MKLLRIRVRNLNSLYGDHDVDIEGKLAGAPLFLIAGPTGAGKSTLMDAISLSLFGVTPRLQEARGSDTDNDARNIMSRGTGEAFAQVELRKMEGGRPMYYRATWSCQRARKRPDGLPQDPKRSLERRASPTAEWVVLVEDHRQKFYAPAFEQMLEGMSVEDFNRSVLLAQGEFAAFLKASDDHRASMLERLTNTTQYRDLGARAAERKREAEAEVRALEAALGGIAVRTDEELEALRQQADATAKAHDETRAAWQAAATFLSWAEADEKLARALAEAERQAQTARVARDASAPQARRLAEHDRCQPAEKALAELERTRPELQQLEEQLPALREKESFAREAAATADLAATQAEQAEAAARTQLATLQPEIQRARAVRASLTHAHEEHQKAQRALALRKETAGNLRREFGKKEAIWSQAQRAATAAAERLQNLAPVVELAQALSALHAEHGELKQLHEASKATRKRRDAQLLTLDSAVQDLAHLESEEQSARGQHDAAVAEANAACAKLVEALCGEKDVVTRRKWLAARREEARRKVAAADEALRAVATWTRLNDGLCAAEREFASLQTRLEGLADAVRTREAEVDAVASRYDDTRQELEDSQWMLSVAEKRSVLVDGEACPLCGGMEHPAARDAEAREMDARVLARCERLKASCIDDEATLKSLRKTLELERAQLAELRGAVTAAQESVVRCRPEFDAADDERRRLEAAVDASGPEALSATRAAAIAMEQEALAAIEALEAADGSAHAATEAEQRAFFERNQRQVLIAERQRAVETGRTLAAELERELTESDQAVRNRAESLEARMGAFGVDVAHGLDRAFADADGRVKSLNDAQRASHETAQAAQEARAAFEAKQVELTGAIAAVSDCEVDVQQRAEALVVHEREAASVLNGADPDEAERRLTSVCDAAREKARLSRKRAEQTQRELAAVEAGLRTAERQTEEATRVAAEALTSFEAVLRRLRLPDEQSLRQRLLSAEEAALWQKQLADIGAAANAAETLLASRQAEFERHRENRPSSSAEPCADLDVLRTRVRTLEEQTSQLGVGLGGLRARLDEDASARKRQAEKQQAIDRARSSLDIWQRLHQLIGINEGNEFKLYAQTLNLAELMARANLHLDKLAPRYSLVGARTATGAARLAFAVRDTFQADEVRPINTLSGGETFLVSLSLALALAGYRTVKVPIETLLLDEGFGTLDPDTVQVAMAALEALNASGTQVGIITHVEGLKERIPARVVVRKGANGRSTVHVEAGGRPLGSSDEESRNRPRPPSAAAVPPRARPRAAKHPPRVVPQAQGGAGAGAVPEVVRAIPLLQDEHSAKPQPNALIPASVAEEMAPYGSTSSTATVRPSKSATRTKGGGRPRPVQSLLFDF